jgi:GMP synthase-like glutamine amidotransferase
MKIHYIKHAPFEGLGSMEGYFLSKGDLLTCTKLYKNNYIFPSIEDIDWLIIIGGPMGVYDTSDYPWLIQEKTFIKSMIDSGKIVIGVCLGAQLIADVLGAKVYKNKYREIGWFPLTRSKEATTSKLGNIFPETINTFHWHGDTFDLPKNAILLASSEACKNQAFSIDGRIFGFQFHFEATPDFVKQLIVNCANELDGSKYVQSREKILSNHNHFDKINLVMKAILNKLEN